jgi:hypothetical protein
LTNKIIGVETGVAAHRGGHTCCLVVPNWPSCAALGRVSEEGRRMPPSNDPYEDLMQGRIVGHDLSDDLTQGREVGEDTFGGPAHGTEVDTVP